MQTSASPKRQRALPLSSPPPESQTVATADKDAPSLFRGDFVWCASASAAHDAPLCLWLPPPHRDTSDRPPPREAALGGLSGWQQKTVTGYIEAHLGEVLRLTDMAQLVRLSPFHFARAFKRSFGLPPHRYHVGRRIERAKDLLGDPANSVTGIARALGFAETSSFSATFRRVTGASPSDFRRAPR